MPGRAVERLPMRTFIAVEVPVAVRDRIAELENRLKGTGTDIKWVEPGNIHITLKFLGNIETDQPAVIRNGLCTALDDIASFDLKLGRVGAFPDLNRPRVFWVSVDEGREELTAMQQCIETELHACGFVREERPFSPHLTIGRVRSPKGLAKLTERVQATTFETEPFTVSRVAVVKSDLKPNGPVYTVIDHVELG